MAEGDTGWDIIDTGLNIPPTHEAWENTLREHGIKWDDIRAVYVTHYHPDHYGAAGWLQEKTGAPVCMSERDLADAKKVWQAGFEFLGDFSDFFLLHGVPADLLKKITGSMIMTARAVFPGNPDITTVSEGEKIRFGHEIYEVIQTPGHADGHLCFFCPGNGILISGDHLLPGITSNISFWPGARPNPLKLFFSSLEKIKQLKVGLAMPAHGEPFTGITERIEELFIHHRERLELISRIAGKGKTAFEISNTVFGTGLSLHEMRFAVSETIAHLVYLENEGAVQSLKGENTVCYKET